MQYNTILHYTMLCYDIAMLYLQYQGRIQEIGKEGSSGDRRELLGGSGRMFPWKILKSGPSKTVISCIFRQLSRCDKRLE